MPLIVTQAPLVPKPGLVVRSTSRVKPGAYVLASTGTTPALTVRGDGITVDFSGATLRGTPATILPDGRKGLGVLVEGRNVTIKGLKAHGYKIGLLARNVKGLKLIDCDLSYNWKQHLLSTLDKEDLSDWMSFHHNEKGEWLGYGVGAYLDHCENFEVKGLKVTGGQSGLFLDRSNKGLVWNSDLSFNSALGIGMYRASDNRIMHNRVDYDVRGFSYGVYNRGQDSAGILIFEQCNRNLFAYNSVTHGGDGFFLWAGQDTMDTGEGGCNDNLLYANDFSHAPTNGIEATFSRNAFVGNRVHGSFHGVWGGYSYDSPFLANDFRDNQRGIAIEHGQANTFGFNRFWGEDVAIALWSNPTQDPNWGYAKKRDTKSRDAKILGNLFVGTPLALDIRGTTNTLLEGNEFRGVGHAVRIPAGQEVFVPLPMENRVAGTLTGLPGKVLTVPAANVPAPAPWNPMNPAAGLPAGAKEAVSKYRVAPLKGGMMPFIPKGTPQGWSTILVDDWGPYDFRRPLLWPEKTVEGGAPLPGGTSAGSGQRQGGTIKETGRYQILGPKGRWRLVSSEGVKMGATSGTVPGVVSIEVPPGRVGTTSVTMEYVGAATTDIRLRSNYREVAAFANSTIHLTPVYDLDVGGRYSHNKQDARVGFILDAITDIHKELGKHSSSLLVLHDKPENAWREVLDKYDVKEVYTNHD
ncbi:hypothetical protein EON82_14180, partial [bacterium]